MVLGGNKIIYFKHFVCLQFCVLFLKCAFKALIYVPAILFQVKRWQFPTLFNKLISIKIFSIVDLCLREKNKWLLKNMFFKDLRF